MQVVWHGDMHGSYLWDMEEIMGGAEGGTWNRLLYEGGTTVNDSDHLTTQPDLSVRLDITIG